MKVFFVEAKYKGEIILPVELVKALPKSIALFSSVQFIEKLAGLKKQLEANGKKVLLTKPEHAKYPGQLLGCSIKKFDEKELGKSKSINAFLYIGDGLFHPKALLIKNNKPVFAYNPFSKKYSEMKQEDVDSIIKKQKGAMLKFLSSKEIGVLISTKPGQQQLKKAYAIEKKYPEKNFYFLVFDTIDFSELENFNFIECFVNTACPRIGYDDSERMGKAVVNADELLN